MKRSRLITPDLTRKLIQKQDQRQGRFGLIFPMFETAQVVPFRSTPQNGNARAIPCIIPAEPLPGFALVEPEVEDLCASDTDVS